MVGVKIWAGFGNQLFQYATGLCLAERLGADLYCDTDTYRRHPSLDRPMELKALGLDWIEARVPTFSPLRQLACSLRLIPDQFRHATRLSDVHVYDPRYETLRGDCALSGYFQSWRHFVGHEDTVRRAFDPARLPAVPHSAAEAAIRAAANPVAVHVRRGDYAISAKNIATYGLQGADYYMAARAEIERRVPNPTYFLFSDEMDRARRELADWQGLVPVSGVNALDDFRLMALCNHFIIANSTFSWWAAWLGKAPDKTVVAPRKWFGPVFAHLAQIEDRLPPDWVVI